MTKIRTPWSARSADFNKPGLHTRMHRGYMMFFEFLRLSPSYELARKARQEGLTAEDQAQLPPDFDRVLTTFDLFGDVQKILFRSWWIKRGLKAFGNPYNKPKVHSLKYLPSVQDIGLADCIDEVDSYLSDTRREEGLNPALLVSIPLGRRKGEVLKQIAKLLDEYSETDTSEMNKPLISFAAKRIHINKLVTSYSVLLFRAAKPKWELWRLGASANVSKTYSPMLDAMAPKKIADPNNVADRQLMAKITYRAIKKAEAIAENAARGKFPSDTPVHQAPFDYPKIAAIISKKNQWERKERSRLMKVFQDRIAAKSSLPSNV